MHTAYIVDALRTPVGKYGGALATVRPDDLLALAVRGLMARNNYLDLNDIEDLIAGDANQAGEDTRNVARMAALIAELPLSVAGNTVNRLCASGLQAVIDAGRAIACGEGEVFIAGGVESMSRAPIVSLRPEPGTGSPGETADSTIGWRFTNPRLTERIPPLSMGQTAENIASRYAIARQEQDEYAANSHRKYFESLEREVFRDELLPVATPRGVVEADEHPRRTSVKMLARLRPVFKEDGSVTAGNSAGLNDGAAALLLFSEAAVKKYNVAPMARIVATAVAGVDPSFMGLGPVHAVRKLLKRAKLSLEDIGLIELNESFACQAIACIRELGLNTDIINVNGGTLALGHPMGCSGARMATTLLHEMRRRQTRYGLAAMCVGLGQGVAVVFEKI